MLFDGLNLPPLVEIELICRNMWVEWHPQASLLQQGRYLVQTLDPILENSFKKNYIDTSYNIFNRKNWIIKMISLKIILGDF